MVEALPRPHGSCERGHRHIWARDGRRYAILVQGKRGLGMQVADVLKVRFCALCGAALLRGGN